VHSHTLLTAIPLAANVCFTLSHHFSADDAVAARRGSCPVALRIWDRASAARGGL